MNKTELHGKHPVILQPEGASLLRDLGNHMRMSTPILPPDLPPDKQMDASQLFRRAGWIEGWLTACNYLEMIRVPDAPRVMPPPTQNYVEPAKPAVEHVPKPAVVPPPNMPAHNFVEPTP